MQTIKTGATLELSIDVAHLEKAKNAKTDFKDKVGKIFDKICENLCEPFYLKIDDTRNLICESVWNWRWDGMQNVHDGTELKLFLHVKKGDSDTFYSLNTDYLIHMSLPHNKEYSENCGFHEDYFYENARALKYTKALFLANQLKDIFECLEKRAKHETQTVSEILSKLNA